eukprot:Sro1414_g270690.1 n/a (349) ;mRNA; r:25455-26501
MMACGMDLQADANAKLLKINQERRANGYPPINAFVYGDDMTGVFWVMYQLEDGSRLMFPFTNDFPDPSMYHRLFKLKLIMPDPFTEAHKTTRFCEIWEFNEDEYINRYHRWLGDVDLLTEEVEGSSTGSDEVNMGGINLRRMERLIDNEASSPEDSPLAVRPLQRFTKEDFEPVIDNDSGTSEVPAIAGFEDRKPSALSPVIDNSRYAKIDGEIDEILCRPFMTEPKDTDSTEGSSSEESTADDDTEDTVEDTATNPAKNIAEYTVADTSVVTEDNATEEDCTEEESPKKKQKTSEDGEETNSEEEGSIDEEATIDREEDDDNDENDEGDNYDTSNGPILLSTGSWSY